MNRLSHYITLLLLIHPLTSFPSITKSRLSTKGIQHNKRKRPNYKISENNVKSNTLIPQLNNHHLQSKTKLNVLTTPESIIEQASTRKLLDDLIDESVRLSARKPIMMQFQPTPYWIWKCWKGTIFSESWPICLRNMGFAFLVSLLFHFYPNAKSRLVGFNILWGQLLSVTTFTLTFFLNVSYGLWRKCYGLSRRLQGRLNDLGLTLAAHAVRNTPSNPKELSTYTPATKQILELVSRYIRLFNILTYASFTRSHRPILTPRGMRRLVERGLMTPIERQALIDADVPATQRHNAVMLWIVRVVIEGRASGHFLGGAGFESEFLEKVHVIRAQVGGIGDELQGRMPLAYAHIVQVLVDVILLLYPFMAFTSEMSIWLGVAGTALLTIFYQGLFDLAKQFLDPYDNENFGNGDDPLCVDTLVAETNAGSIRWMNGFNEMPFSSQKIKEGELQEYLLPLKGYSVQELAKFKKDQEEKEVKMKLEEERNRIKKIQLRRSKRLDLISKYYTKETTKTNGWAIKKVAPLNDQTIITYELLSTDDDNVTITSIGSDGTLNDVNITLSNITSSVATMPFILNDTDVSRLLVKLMGKACDHLVYCVRHPKKEVVEEEIVLEEDGEVMGNWTNMIPTIKSNDTMTSSMEDYIAVDNITVESTIETKEDIQKLPFYNVSASSKTNTTMNAVNGDYSTTIPTFESNVTTDLKANGTDEISLRNKVLLQTASAIPVEKMNMDDTIPIQYNKTREESLLYDDMYKLYSQEDGLIKSSLFDDLWLDEISPDGKEIRLSQLLADEDEDEDVITTKLEREKQEQEDGIEGDEATKQQKSFEEKIKEANEEWKETEAILSASPGRDSNEDDLDHDKYPEQKIYKAEASDTVSSELVEDGYYDQTTLDSVSQLWGASPSILGKKLTSSSKDMFDVYKNEQGSSISSDNNQGSTVSLSSSDKIEDLFPNVATLWGMEKPPSKQPIVDQYDNDTPGTPYGEVIKSYWFDEIDGEEVRLSQLLANDEDVDDDWDTNDDIQSEDNIISIQDVIDKLEEEEEERLETEAILNAEPGANWLEDDEDDNEGNIDIDGDHLSFSEGIIKYDDVQNAEEEMKEILETEAILNAAPGANSLEDDQEDVIEEDDELDVLEMDVVDEVEQNTTMQSDIILVDDINLINEDIFSDLQDDVVEEETGDDAGNDSDANDTNNILHNNSTTASGVKN